MKMMTSLLAALVLTLTAALPASASEQALRELQAMSDMTDAELQAMADDLGKTLEERKRPGCVPCRVLGVSDSVHYG